MYCISGGLFFNMNLNGGLRSPVYLLVKCNIFGAFSSLSYRFKSIETPQRNTVPQGAALNYRTGVVMVDEHMDRELADVEIILHSSYIQNYKRLVTLKIKLPIDFSLHPLLKLVAHTMLTASLLACCVCQEFGNDQAQ